MIEIISDERMITFDGKVLEVFKTRGESRRFHVGLIQSITLAQKRRGYSIAIGYTAHNMPEEIGVLETQVPQAQALVAAVNQAKA